MLDVAARAPHTVDWQVERKAARLLERNWRALSALIAISLDFAAAWIATNADRQWRQHVMSAGGALGLLQQPMALWTPMLFVASNVMFGVYRQLYIARHSYQIRRVVASFIAASLIIVAFDAQRDYSLGPADLRSLLLRVAVGLIAARGIWEVIRQTMQARGWALDRTIVICPGGQDHNTVQWLRRLRSIGYDVRAVIDSRASPSELRIELNRQVALTDSRSVLVWNTDLVTNGYKTLLAHAKVTGLKVTLLSYEVQSILARAGVSDVRGITITSPQRHKISRFKSAAKRIVDLVLGGPALLLFVPVLVAIAVAIKLESRGPLFFKQRRSLSKDSPSFLFYKLRSMFEDADGQRTQLREQTRSSGALFKMRRDPRVTLVGRVIRRLSLDELPQLFNVIAGDMSLVGPRPLPADDYAQMTERETVGGLCHLRATIKAGMTGLWQTCGRSKLGTFEMMLLDLYYLQNHTIFFDLEILLRTIPVVLLGRGAY